jgi:uncharacterized membrane protein
MSSRPLPARRRPIVLLATLSPLVLAAGCSSGGGDNITDNKNPTITVAVNPTSASVEQGASTDVSVTVTGGGGFTGSATISVQGAPSGVTGTVSNVQSSNGNTTATVTIAVGASVAADNYSLTIHATGSGVSPDDATFSLTVTAAPAYELSATPASLAIGQGGEGTTDIAITRTNFTDDVTLAVEGAPGGVSGSFDTNPVSGDAATLTLAVDDTVTTGTYTLTIRGTATGLADRTVDIEVMVTTPATPDYMLATDPDPVTINQGDSADVAITVTRSNFNGDITLAAEGLPTDVTVAFSTNPVTGNTSTMTVKVAGTVATGDYSFTLRGTATGISDKTVAVHLTVASAPAYSLTLNPTSISIDQSASGTVDVTLTRTNFTDAVDLSLENAPTGVTGTFDPDPATGDASTLTLDVGASVAPGDYTLTVRGTATGLADVTATLTLTVTAAAGFSLDAIDPISVEQGASGTRTVTITRTGGFTGDVTVTVSGSPAGITASVDPVTTSGNSVDITIDVAGSVSTGTYTVTVHGNATGLPESTQSLQISVTTSSGQSVSLDFSVCTTDQRPTWLAYQDGTGPWTTVSGVGDTYTFNVASSTAGVAIATAPSGGGSGVFVLYATQSELVTGDLSDVCDVVATGKTVNGSVSGITPANGEQATVSLGDATTQAASDGPVTFSAVPSGNLDLVGFKSSLNDATDRMIFMRDLNPADGSNIGTIDFATNGFDPISATITLLGGPGGGGTWEVEYATSPSAGVCYYVPLQTGSYIGSEFTARGAPAAQQQAGDFHVFTVTEGFSRVSQMFATLASHTLTFGQALPTPTITDITGASAYRRLRAELTLPAEYNSIATFTFADGSGDHSIAVLATAAWLGGLNVSMEVPDLSGAAGWNDAWAPASASSVDWTFIASGWTGDDCTEGAREVNTVTFGTVN